MYCLSFALQQKLHPVNKKIAFILVCFTFFAAQIKAQKLTVATYNMRNSNSGDSANGNGWGQRYPVIAQLITFHNFDIFGTQECKYNQLQDLQNTLTGYTYIGIGRDDGKQAGEFSAIFFKKNKFELLSKGDFWMSTNTHEPNKGWDAALPRICSWGKFKEKNSGFVFFFFNLHMDHIGVVARRESAKLVMDTVRKMAGNIPTILTGDFNVDQHNESYTLINTSGLLKDSYELSPIKYALNGTFNDFDINNATTSRIDHIFLTKAFTVLRYGILTDNYKTILSQDSLTSANFPKEVRLVKEQPRLPSDHYPVMAEIEFKK